MTRRSEISKVFLRAAELLDSREEAGCVNAIFVAYRECCGDEFVGGLYNMFYLYFGGDNNYSTWKICKELKTKSCRVLAMLFMAEITR